MYFHSGLALITEDCAPETRLLWPEDAGLRKTLAALHRRKKSSLKPFGKGPEHTGWWLERRGA